MNNFLIIGIDWADSEHAFHLVADDGTVHAGQFKQHPKAINEILSQWEKLAHGAKLAIAIESNKGALINNLVEVQGVVVYPINPLALSKYRESHKHGGGKSDPVDAELLARFLSERIEQLQPLHKNSPLTRELATLSQDRRRFVDQRADLANELTAMLKQYFPAALELKPAKPYADFFLQFLIAYSTLTLAQKAGASKLRQYFHGVGMKRKADKHAQILVDAIPLCNDEVTIRSTARRVVAIAEQLQALTKHIKRYNATLTKLLPTHPDYAVVSNLPGSSTNTQSRIVSALGDDRTRFPDAASLQRASGIAPITKQSGKMKLVSSRWATTKFMRQTFHEYAGLSVAKSRWAKAFYELQKSKGKDHQAAVRSLAFKWQRIIFACWKSHQSYDEQKYIERLVANGCELGKRLSEPTKLSAKPVKKLPRTRKQNMK